MTLRDWLVSPGATFWLGVVVMAAADFWIHRASSRRTYTRGFNQGWETAVRQENEAKQRRAGLLPPRQVGADLAFPRKKPEGDGMFSRPPRAS